MKKHDVTPGMFVRFTPKVRRIIVEDGCWCYTQDERLRKEAAERVYRVICAYDSELYDWELELPKNSVLSGHIFWCAHFEPISPLEQLATAAE